MMSQVTQLKLSLPDPLYDFVQSKAQKFGLPLSSYVKNLIINDVKDMEYPVYQASEKLEKSYTQALKEYPQATEVSDIDTFFDGL